MCAFSFVNFLFWFSSLDGETTKPCPLPPVEDEGGEEAKKSIVKEKRGKKKKKRTTVDKRHPKDKMSDFDDLLFVSRSEVKQRGRNSLSSNEEEFRGKEVALEKYKY